VASDGAEAIVPGLSRGERQELEAVFRRLRRHWADPPREARNVLARRLRALLGRLDPVRDT
jgi:hypothetical protein